MTTNDWTAERLDALPEVAVVKIRNTPFVKELGAWAAAGHLNTTPVEHLLRYSSEIRVVSVPVEALLSDEAVRAAASALHADACADGECIGADVGDFDREAGTALRAAIANITGGAR